MYYFTYPDEMMEGEVNTPGCFLEAKIFYDATSSHIVSDTWISNNSENSLAVKYQRPKTYG